MPRTFLVPIDLSKQELRNARLQNLAVAPSSPVVGQLYYDTAEGEIRIWDGEAWVPVGGGGEVDLSDVILRDGTQPFTSDNVLLREWTGAGNTDWQVLFEFGSVHADFKSIVDGVTGPRLRLHGESGDLTVFSADGESMWAQFRVLANGSAEILASQALYMDVPAVTGPGAGLLRDRTTHTGVQAISTVDGLQAALDTKADDHDHTDYQEVSEKGAAGGYAGLDAQGLVPSAQLPDIAIGQRFEVADQAAMLALDAQVGDVAVRTDNDGVYLLIGTDATDLANWHPLTSAEGGVASVGGSSPIASSGGANPVISLDDDGVLTQHLGDAQVTPDKLSFTPLTKAVFDVGDDSATEFVLTHNLNTRDVQVQARQAAAPYAVVEPDIEMTGLDSVTVRFANAPATDEFRVAVIG